MDSNRIKNLAMGMRDALRAEVSSHLDSILAEGSSARLESPGQVRNIETSILEHGRETIVDQAAYTWFNRLCALRFMDANKYTPVPVVTPRDGSTQPAILADAAQGSFDPDWDIPGSVRERVTGLLLGTITSSNPSEDAYEELLTAVCAHYSEPMGYLFSEDVASALLMPHGLLAQDSILSRIVEVLDEETCSDVEVLGWLYQFYIAERKDEYFASKRKATAADIPAATQLFTPRWIAAFLTENSLGRLWVNGNPESDLVAEMKYFISSDDNETGLVATSAEDILVLDPACGSGHILVCAFDLLFKMYEEEGWPDEEIPQMILENNLFGLEIDRRAAEIASFALEMKARARDPQFFEKDIDANIKVLEPVVLDAHELVLVPRLAKRRSLLDAMSHLDELGSLYVPDPADEDALIDELVHFESDGSLFAESLLAKLKSMQESIRALSQNYHCVIANPPYMGSGYVGTWMNSWLRNSYPEEKADLCTCFINRGLRFAKLGGYASLVTMHSWMFLTSYEAMRRKLFSSRTIVSMAHLGARAFDSIGGEVVQTAATAFLNQKSSMTGGFVRLVDLNNSNAKKTALLEVTSGDSDGRFFRASVEDFQQIPGMAIAYWASDALRNAFREGKALSTVSKPRQGLATADNSRFLRFWWEPAWNSVKTNSSSREEAALSGRTWFPCDKGGPFRKWYGNNEYLVNWRNDGEEVKGLVDENGKQRSRPQNLEFYFKPYVCWTNISTGNISFREKPAGHIIEHCSDGLFCDKRLRLGLMALMNSSVATSALGILAPTLHFEVGQVAKVPILSFKEQENSVERLSEECVSLSRDEYDSFETSWDFLRHPMAYVNAEGPTRIADTYARWESECRDRFDTLKANEEELNRIFARIYHMEGEVPTEVPDDKVSVRLADRARDARSLVSYIVGCVFGRYSWECGALAIANQGETVQDYCSWSRVAGEDLFFVPDNDNVLPVLADEWFDDDIVTEIRRWLAHAYGAEALEENVTWLEESLGKNLRTYLVRDFYADHLKVYQKRPIYWMFQSPKKSFQCLVYMHRYDEGTVGTILTGYLRPLEDKLRARLQVLESPSATAADTREANRVRGMIAELEQWEREVIYPLAHERVSIDLDDGVKVNYNKFPRALAKVPGLSDWK